MDQTIEQHVETRADAVTGMPLRWRLPVEAGARAVPLLLLATAVAMRAFLIAHGWPALQSDEALLALMGRHILLDGQHPLFFWGQSYLVPVESYLFAGAFAIFGISTVVFRGVLLAITTVFLWLVYQLGRAIYGRTTGWLTLTYLALGPFWALFGEIRARGAYIEDMTLGAALFLLVRRSVHAPARRRAWPHYALMGLLAGVGFMIHPIMLVYIAPAAVVLALARRRELLGQPGLVALAVMVVICIPLLAYNISHPAATLAQLWAQNGSDSHASSFLSSLWRSWQATWAIGLPIAVSGPETCATVTVPAWLSWLATGCRTIDQLIVAGGSLIIAGMTLALLWRLRRRTSRTTQALSQPERAEQAPMDKLLVQGQDGPQPRYTVSGQVAPFERTAPDPWGEALLVGLVLATIIPYCLSKSAYQDADTAPRYLLPLYVAAPLFIGRLWHGTSGICVAGHTHRHWEQTFHCLWRAVLLMLLGWNLFGYMQTVHDTLTHPSVYANPMPPKDARLISYLEQHHLTRIYAEYWVGYRLIFLSNEQVIAADISPNLHPFYDRYPPYAAALHATAHPAYVLLAGTSGAAEFDRLAAKEHLPHTGYKRLTIIGNYVVYGYAP